MLESPVNFTTRCRSLTLPPAVAAVPTKAVRFILTVCTAKQKSRLHLEWGIGWVVMVIGRMHCQQPRHRWYEIERRITTGRVLSVQLASINLLRGDYGTVTVVIICDDKLTNLHLGTCNKQHAHCDAVQCKHMCPSTMHHDVRTLASKCQQHLLMATFHVRLHMKVRNILVLST